MFRKKPSEVTETQNTQVGGGNYFVGATDDGSTVLSMIVNNMSMSLTMDGNNVRKLIKLLEATLDMSANDCGHDHGN
jgi:hypothetical protein